MEFTWYGGGEHWSGRVWNRGGCECLLACVLIVDFTCCLAWALQQLLPDFWQVRKGMTLAFGSAGVGSLCQTGAFICLGDFSAGVDLFGLVAFFVGLLGCFIGCLVGYLVAEYDCLVGWLVVWLFGCLIGWLAGGLIDSLIGDHSPVFTLSMLCYAMLHIPSPVEIHIILHRFSEKLSQPERIS